MVNGARAVANRGVNLVCFFVVSADGIAAQPTMAESMVAEPQVAMGSFARIAHRRALCAR